MSNEFYKLCINAHELLFSSRFMKQQNVDLKNERKGHHSLIFIHNEHNEMHLEGVKVSQTGKMHYRNKTLHKLPTTTEEQHHQSM